METKTLPEIERAIDKLIERPNRQDKGPRNLPKPSAKKKTRVAARNSRRRNRPVKRRKSRSRR